MKTDPGLVSHQPHSLRFEELPQDRRHGAAPHSIGFPTPCYQAILGVGGFVAPLGETRLITRLFQFERKGL